MRAEYRDGTPEALLVQRAVAGEGMAFDLLTRQYYQRVTRLIEHVIHDQASVGDLTQDTFLHAFQGIRQFEGNSAFYTWLHAIAMHTALGHVKRQQHHPISVDFNDDIAYVLPSRVKMRDYSTPENWLYCDEMQDKIEAALDHLPKVLRTSLLLREVDGLSYEAIAAKMHCPTGTVRSRIARARKRVDAQVKPYLV